MDSKLVLCSIVLVIVASIHFTHTAPIGAIRESVKIQNGPVKKLLPYMVKEAIDGAVQVKGDMAAKCLNFIESLAQLTGEKIPTSEEDYENAKKRSIELLKIFAVKIAESRGRDSLKHYLFVEGCSDEFNDVLKTEGPNPFDFSVLSSSQLSAVLPKKNPQIDASVCQEFSDKIISYLGRRKEKGIERQKLHLDLVRFMQEFFADKSGVVVQKTNDLVKNCEEHLKQAIIDTKNRNRALLFQGPRNKLDRLRSGIKPISVY